jgi:hypothetical protein
MQLVLGCSAAGAVVLAGPVPSPQHPTADVAEFILNIARYASWPKGSVVKTLTACYAVGAAPVALAAPAGPSVPMAQDSVVKGVPVIWLPITTPQQIAGCHIVWLSADVRPAPRRWIAAVLDQPVLTLSNYADFAADGGVIGAYRVGQDWRFEINIEALQRSGVNISATALRLSQKPRAIVGAVGTGEPR